MSADRPLRVALTWGGALAVAAAAAWSGLRPASETSTAADSGHLPDGSAAGTPALFVLLLVVAALSSLAVWALRKRPQTSKTPKADGAATDDALPLGSAEEG